MVKKQYAPKVPMATRCIAYWHGIKMMNPAGYRLQNFLSFNKRNILKCSSTSGGPLLYCASGKWKCMETAPNFISISLKVKYRTIIHGLLHGFQKKQETPHFIS